jgi:TRAP-type C4-dicarboxylate transport system substrate-binding protein
MDAVRGRILSCGTAAVVILALMAACGGGTSVDKAGGETAVLTLATIDEINNNGQSYGPEAFVDRLGKISGGKLRVKVTASYGGGAADAESTLVKAIASGELDGGWPSTRSFANAGIAGLSVVEAPMTLTSYAAEKALVTGGVAETLLSRLDSTGVVGLGLAVGPLRRPFAAKAPLLGPADWQGAAFRVYNSPTQADTVRALGGIPTNLGFEWIDKIREGSLRGAEFDIAQYEHNGNAPEAGNVTANVVLWPKVFVLSLSRKRFDTLTTQQQAWVRQAAQQAVKASVDATYDETTIARGLCGKGVRFINATAEQIAALHTKLQPVLDKLAANPADTQVLHDIQALARQDPDPDVPDVPASCQQSPTGATTNDTIPKTVSKLPDGVYRVEITRDEVVTAGLSLNDGPTGTWTLTVKHGTYQGGCRPIADPGLDCGHGDPKATIFEVGDLRGVAQTVYFVPDAKRLSRLTGCTLPVSETLPGHCGPDRPYVATWALAGDQLRFIGDLSPVLTLKPYRKIA